MDRASSQTQLSPVVPSLQSLLTAGASPSAVENVEDYSDMPPLDLLRSAAPSVARRRYRGSSDLWDPWSPLRTRRDSSTSNASVPSPAVATRRPTRSAALAARAAIASSSQKQAAIDPGTPKKRPAKAKRAAPSSVETISPAPKKKARSSSRKPPPNAKKDSDYEDKKPSPENSSSCCICICEPEREELSKINGCEHRFCFACIAKWADRENTCPLCKSRFSKIERVFPQKRKKGQPSVSNTKRVKQRDQRSDIVSGAALEGLLASISAGGGAPGGSRLGRFIFARMGSAVFPMQAGSVARSTRLTFSVEDNLFDSDDDDDDNFPNFMNVLMRQTMAAQRASSSATLLATRTARSYATNANDNNAGRAASNPLEIDDSDDDDVEVVQVTRGL